MIYDDYNILRCLSLILFFCFAERIAGFSSNHYSICLQTRVYKKNNVHLASSGGEEAFESLPATVETTSTSLFNVNSGNLQRLTGTFDPKSFEKMAEQKVERQCELKAQVMVEKAVEDVINAQYKSGILQNPSERDPPSFTSNTIDVIDVTESTQTSLDGNEFQQLKSNSVFPLKQDGNTNSQDNLHDGLLVDCKNFIADASNNNVGTFGIDSEIDISQTSDPHSLDDSLDFHDIVIDVEDSTELLIDTTVEESKEVPLEMGLTLIDKSHDSSASRNSYDNQMDHKSDSGEREIESVAHDKIQTGSKQDIYRIDTVKSVMEVINNNIYTILDGTTNDYSSSILGVVDLEDGLGIEHEESLAKTMSFLISSPISVDQKSKKTSKELRELELIAESKVEKVVEAQVEAETEALVESAVILPTQKQVEKKIQQMEEKAEAERLRAEADRLKLEQERVEAERLQRAEQEEEEAKLRKRLEAQQLENERLERKARIAYLERKNSEKRKQLYREKLDRDRREAKMIEQEYAGLSDADKAYRILINLGLIQEHREPISPQLDDEELAPVGIWL
ncbi:predicted protein [Chaetoceros tenuissimus]|uniref:Uncharacterized protein n=1 Tax=Chaetoceros tenuissimus TaxID=426638 RepID=A0AAD3D9T6_9STRA|nr:predicted protein [Chaetoceros tenuissimus]